MGGNEERKGGRNRINERIGEEEWRKYFTDLLDRSEGRVICGRREVIGGKGLEREEVEMAIRRLKVGKVAGKDSLGGEVWKYAGEG